jgi:hypothetical protein
MFLKPESLLACVEAMSNEQRAQLRELLYSEPDDDFDTDLDMMVIDRVLNNTNVQRPATGPMPGSREYAEMFGSKLLDDIMPDISVRMVRPLVEAVGTEACEEGFPPPPDDTSMAQAMANRALYQRWLNARERWQMHFDEAEIPAIREAGDEIALNLVEGMIYDKEHKGIDPSRCTCGCGYVVGCGRGRNLAYQHGRS